jgi:hypothetical protein
MDLAQQVLTSVCDEILHVDQRWSVRAVNGCAWWPFDLAQHITTHPITRDYGRDHGILLDVETDVLQQVPLDDEAVPRNVNRANWNNSLSALALGDDSVLRLRFALRIFADTWQTLQPWAGLLSACQAADALELSNQPEAIHGSARRATSEHPTSGRRADADEILKMRDRLIGLSRNMSVVLDDGAIASGLAQASHRPARPRPAGGCVTTRRWHIPLRPELADRWSGHGDLSTLAMTVEDRNYGPAITMITWPPYAPPAHVATTLAMALNDMPREEWATATTLGTWLAREQEAGVAVRTVIPAAMCGSDVPDGLLASVANAAIYQAQQCSELPIVVQTLTPNLEGPEPFLSETADVT